AYADPTSGTGQHPLVVTGLAGSGKSALLARLATESRQRFPGALVLPHFIGAVAGSDQLTVTLRSLLGALKRAVELTEDVPEDPRQLRGLLPAFLKAAGSRKPVVLIIDAVNQLDPAERSHELDWLPLELPPSVRLIVSSLAGPCLERLCQSVPPEQIIAL